MVKCARLLIFFFHNTMAAACAQCCTTDRPLAESRHLAPLQFCGATCRDAYIGETHRYRPCPDRDTHCLVPVGAPLAELWRREVAPLLGQAPSVAATDYALHRGLVEPIAAALQRIGKNGVKRGRDATDTPLAASDDDQPPAAPVPAGSATVPPRSVMMHGAPSLQVILSAATDDEVLRLWHAAVGTSFGRTLESPQFWEERWRPRLGEMFVVRAVQRFGFMAGTERKTMFVGDDIVKPFVLLPYATFGGRAVDTSLRVLFDLLVTKVRHEHRTSPAGAVVRMVFSLFFEVALTYASLPTLRVVLTHRYNGTEGVVLKEEHSPALKMHGFISTLLADAAFSAFSNGVPWTPRCTGATMQASVDVRALFYAHVANFLRMLIDWRNEFGSPAFFSHYDTDYFNDTLNSILNEHVTKLIVQIARLNLTGQQYMVMKAIVTGDAVRIRALLPVVAPDGSCVDLRNLMAAAVIFDPRDLAILHPDSLALVLAWRHPQNDSVGVDARKLVHVLSQRSALGGGPGGYDALPSCVPLLAAWRDPPTGAAISWAQPKLISHVMEAAAHLYQRSTSDSDQADTMLRTILLASKTEYITDVVMQQSSDGMIDTFIRYLGVLFKTLSELPDTARVVGVATFMGSAPPWTSTAFATNPIMVVSLWLSVLKIRTVNADGSTQDIGASNWVRDNARLYFGRMSTTHGYTFGERYNFIIPRVFWQATGAPLREMYRLNLLLRALWVKCTVAQLNDPELASQKETIRDFLASNAHSVLMSHGQETVVAAYAADGVPLEPTAEEAALGLYRSMPLVAAPPASASLSAAAAAATTPPLTRSTAKSSLDA